MNQLTQHPLKLSIPRLSCEEVNSLIFCEGIVPLTKIEAMQAISLEWFKELPAYQRALFTCSVFDWCAVGSNQHKRKQHQGSPKACAAASKQIIEKAMV